MASSVPAVPSSGGNQESTPACPSRRFEMPMTLAEFDMLNEDGFDPRKLSKEAPKPWSEWRLKDFEIGKPLGAGLLGHVYLARTKKEKFLSAIKVMHVEQIKELDQWHGVERELDIHGSLSHDHIIEMYGSFRDRNRVVFVLEYAAGGEVYKSMNAEQEKRFDNQKAATYLYQITLALEYLHAQGILHRDIKPENLLIGSHGEIKLADFGMSVRITAGEEQQTICGTADYLPPEMIAETGYSSTGDIWSLGILLYEFLVGNPPFCSQDQSKAERNIIKGEFVIPDFVDDEAKDLIKKILVLNPEDRPSLAEIRNHSWCVKYRSSEKKLIPLYDCIDHLLPELAARFEKMEVSKNLAGPINESLI